MDTKEVKLSDGTLVILKPFIDRKTMRDYRKAIAKNSKTEPILEADGRPKIDKEGMPMNRVNIDPAQIDLSNDVLVCGLVETAAKNGETIPINETFFDSMSSDDFDSILDVALKLMKKKDKEKKS